MAKDVTPKEEPVELPAHLTAFDRNRMDFDALVDNALEVEGADLLKGELFDELVGVPFAVFKATFRPGTPFPDGRPGGYVSLECMVGNEAWMRKRKVNMDEKPFGFEDVIVINDGSTGIYRQVVKALVSQGIVELGGVIVDGGGKGESTYDLPCDNWERVNGGELLFNGEEGSATYGRATFTVDINLFCPRGIRVSDDYEWAPGQKGKTRYLA